MTQRFTIHQLVAAAAAALSDAALEQSSGRVAQIPQVRTVRFYTTHGLIDPPAAFDGRRALYEERHLLQLIAIKQLQAQGLDLAAIQARMLGADDDTLRAIAQVDLHALRQLPLASPDAEQDDEEGFWRTEPTPAPPTPAAPRSAEARASPPADLLALTGLRLTQDLLLLLERPARPLTAEDQAALRAAAEPLIHVLRARKLISE